MFPSDQIRNVRIKSGSQVNLGPSGLTKLDAESVAISPECITDELYGLELNGLACLSARTQDTCNAIGWLEVSCIEHFLCTLLLLLSVS